MGDSRGCHVDQKDQEEVSMTPIIHNPQILADIAETQEIDLPPMLVPAAQVRRLFGPP